jgi:ribosome biogenesis GTPase / thiamine phosphate phosphatase
LKARVYKSTGSWYSIKTEEGKFINARIKGVLKMDGRTSTNPIAVGDWVEYTIENEVEQNAIIHNIADRKNYINRQSPANKHAHHIIASNLDQTLLFATLKDPKTSLGFIDRFLITAEAYHVPAILVFNKADLYRKKELALYEHIKTIYSNCGYKVLLLSLENGMGVAELKNELHHKTTLISGHSGVGKSTFINTIFPEFTLRTQDVSDWSGKGLHTTTFAEMFDLPDAAEGVGGSIIDTPGIRELGLVDIKKVELSQYFPEMRKVLNDCQYNDCLHYNEKNCGVKDALNNNALSEERYISYLTLLDGIVEKKY